MLPGLRAYWLLHSDHPAAQAEHARIARALALVSGVGVTPKVARRMALNVAIVTGRPEGLDPETRREYDDFMRGMAAMLPPQVKGASGSGRGGTLAIPRFDLP